MSTETWPCPVRDWATRAPDSPAIRSAAGEWTYQDFDAHVEAAVSGLARRGMTSGDRLALFAEPSARVLAVLLAAFRLGAAVCPLNLRLPDAQVAAAATRLGARLLISNDAFVNDNLSRCTVSELLDSDCDILKDAAVWPDVAAAVLMTSGSTGTPKAAVLTYRNLFRNAEASNRNIPLAPGDTWLLSLPLYHVSGLGVLFRCVLAGAAVAIPEAGQELAAAMKQYGATHVSLVATQLRRFLEDDAGLAALSACKAILLGGSALP
ncbi:MAG: AMP-binding protein [Candidatus Hydrogenedentales bacterium]